MFSIEFLNKIRAHELEFYKPFLPEKARLLEIGGGTGIQARQLCELGLNVVSVDRADSNYSEDREYPIIDYDGESLPFDDQSFDIVFSSNVLEHIDNLEMLHDEINRVLKKTGYSIHAMPSSTWRLWTNIAHYIELLQRVTAGLFQALPTTITFAEVMRIKNKLAETWKTITSLAVPPVHGEQGNCFTELYTFNRYCWHAHFKKNRYTSIEIFPMKLFYTGHMILGNRLPIKVRNWLASILGSSCVLYKVRR